MFNEVWFIPVHPKAVGRGYVLFNTRHVFMDLALCTGAQSCWNRRESSSNWSHKAVSKALSKLSWYAKALHFPFIAQCWNNNPILLFLPPPNFTVDTMLVTIGNVLLASAKPRHTHQALWFITPQNRFPLLQSPVSVCFLYTTYNAWIIFVDVMLHAAARPQKPIS